ncbi:DeoR/GlpR family DNA-binding transcription regulator [Plantactinospora mayteni]|uniref:Lactose phosphotransferase system repressor n=1 Tax=Plantactinospora mayteni TaxID=566021 RepID=A0ABQ4F1B1_9ACTN|nr:DeoR/GlpR family DNA-binding transcription regulator [Plantactinospora mayteni]GIH00648.1 DeoR family transcriptional regulator [Plantactinospora mayteni]
MRYTQAPERRRELLRRVGEMGYVSSTEAAAALGVSEMTIRRDLRQLAAEGLVNRVAGGASIPSPTAGLPFEQRRVAAPAEKAALARATVPLVRSEAVVALDAGTTVAALAARLPGGHTVVTHSVPVIVTCAEREDIELIALGGSYDPQTRSFTGPVTRRNLDDLAVDVAVLSATAAGPGGAYSANASDADTKRAMARIARRVILLLDHGKLEARAPMRFLDLAAVDAVVTDAGATAEQVAMLRAACRQVVVAPLTTPAPVLATPAPAPAPAPAAVAGDPAIAPVGAR